jgi:hypothetical protein
LPERAPLHRSACCRKSSRQQAWDLKPSTVGFLFKLDAQDHGHPPYPKKLPYQERNSSGVAMEIGRLAPPATQEGAGGNGIGRSTLKAGDYSFRLRSTGLLPVCLNPIGQISITLFATFDNPAVRLPPQRQSPTPVVVQTSG